MIQAFIIGIAFGFVLERGGLGNAKKLAAQFYLEDMTVFKVMFTAIITAMVGVYVLTSIGFIQPSQLYVSPTFVLPQIAGGIFFGIGFVMGGYCPGTSCVSASTGRRDAFVFVGGMVAGIFLFGNMFRFVENFYFSTSLGATTLPQLFNLPQGISVAGIVAAAFVGFVVAERVEKKFSKRIM